MSPIGEPVPRLPPIVAPLRISRDANCGNSSASSGTAPSSRRSISVRVSAAPISIWSSPTVRPRSSASRSIAITESARAPRRLTSTPQSVEPATTDGVGSFAQQLQRVGQVAGPGELAAVVAQAGRGAAARGAAAAARGERVVGRRARPSAYAASRIGR